MAVGLARVRWQSVWPESREYLEIVKARAPEDDPRIQELAVPDEEAPDGQGYRSAIGRHVPPDE